MATFNIQTINGEIKHDFAFQLAEAVNYQNWYYDQVVHEIIKSEHVLDDPTVIPVGSLDFVFMHLNKHYEVQEKDIQPINIPTDLMKFAFLKRECAYLKREEIEQKNDFLFIKSASRYKSFLEVTASFDSLPDDTFLVSEHIEIESEWRFFVNSGELLSMHHYLGDFTQTPDFELVKRMVQAYKSAPTFYTLDVGVNKKGTFVIEVHPIVSCGLYGFQNNRLLPQMTMNGFQYMKEQALLKMKERTTI